MSLHFHGTISFKGPKHTVDLSEPSNMDIMKAVYSNFKQILKVTQLVFKWPSLIIILKFDFIPISN